MAEKNKRIVNIQEKISRGINSLHKEIREKIREYYQENPEKAVLRRNKRRKLFRRFLIFRKGFRTREKAMSESMAKLISDMDQKNEELALRTTNVMRLSNLKLRIAREYAELNKAKLLVILTVVLMIATAVAAGVSSITGYEYSYNGRVLGVVKEQEDVLKILDVVQDQLSKEHNAEVAIDRNLDIHFDRVIALNREIDDSEEVLRQLTYMQDMKIKAVGLYVNGIREAILTSEEDAQAVLEAVKNSFLSTSASTEYEKIGFAEAVEIKKIDTKLGRIMNVEDTMSKIMTGAIAKRTHQVVSGDTFSGIAKKYNISSSDLRMANPAVNPERLSIGQEIILTQTVPMLTVQTVEVATYIEPIPFETVQNETSAMYKGEQSVRVQGVNGERSVVARIIKNNGVEISKTELSSVIIKNPVDKVLNVGTKPPPALQGTGSFIYPVTGARLTTRYSRYHQAIDLAISSGTKIRASDGGTVISSGYSGSYGYVVRINHGGNRVTLYAHCSKLLVKAGDKVFQGQHIANVGSTGRSTGPHVHFEVIINGVKRNPLDYL
jgi:murein DD-endopeptidase MepM/ murein hydrolase activator NlpD